MKIILVTLLTLSILGIILAVILYVIARSFQVHEDPRIDEVVELLPGANCGGCGYPGCRGLAEAAVTKGSLAGIFCPVGGNTAMQKIADVLGLAVEAKEPQVAVIRCNGTIANRKKTTDYDGVKTCAIAAATYAGDTDCSFGCLGYGDCVAACPFGGITMNAETGLPIVDENHCEGCGACVKACPKNVIELRNKGRNNRRVFVACQNKDRGADARKACAAACIGCGKCAKVCPFEAITIQNNCAYIDFTKCKACGKCAAECPTGAIHAVNFPKPKNTAPTADTSNEKTEILN